MIWVKDPQSDVDLRARWEWIVAGKNPKDCVMRMEALLVN